MKPRGGGNNCGKLTKPREPDWVLIDRHATSVCSPPERMGGDRLRRTMHPLIIRFPLPSPWGEKSRGGLSRVHVRISKVNSLYGYICVCVCRWCKCLLTRQVELATSVVSSSSRATPSNRGLPGLWCSIRPPLAALMASLRSHGRIHHGSSGDTIRNGVVPATWYAPYSAIFLPSRGR